jgi:class 3 adenylate cyclase
MFANKERFLLRAETSVRKAVRATDSKTRAQHLRQAWRDLKRAQSMPGPGARRIAKLQARLAKFPYTSECAFTHETMRSALGCALRGP